MEADDWLRHLQQHGYCVVRNVASADEIEKAKSLFWDCIEATNPGVERGDVETWQKWKVGSRVFFFFFLFQQNFVFSQLDSRGIVLDGDVLHSAGAWFLRGLPLVRQSFARVWNDDDLVCSFDSTIIWRPWTDTKLFKPRVEGLHIDQNPFDKPGLCCVQGMLPLFDVTPDVGGLAVVPDSHLDLENLKKRNDHWRLGGDFCVLSKQDPQQGKAKLVECKAGDLILWDSRCLHVGMLGAGQCQSKVASVSIVVFFL